MIRTLLVDDFEDLLFIACKFLEKQAPSIEIVTCESAKDALKKLDEEHFDIIVSDYQMPEMDGLEFLEVVRKSGNEIPFIIFTGRGREEVAIQALNLGATHYLKKGGEQRSQFAELAHHIRTAVSHRRSEIALHESEGRYRSLFEDAAVSLWEEDFSAVKKFFDEKRTEGITDFREYFENHPEDVEKCVKLVIVKDVNKASLLAQGVREKEELIGPLERVFVKDALEVYREELISLAEGNTLYKSEIHILNDVVGRKHAFIFQLNVPPGYEESLAKVYLSIIDVTKQYQSEILAEQESKKAQTYLELSSVMFVALDKKGRVSFVNSHTCSILGYEENELIGKDWFDLTIPETVKEEVKSAFNEIMHGHLELVANFESPILTKDGDERIITWHNAYLTDESGKINGVLSSGEDITDKKMMDEALKSSENQLKHVFQESPIALAYYSLDGEMIDANPRYLKLFGIESVEAFQGYKLQSRLLNHINKNLDTQESFIWELEYDFDDAIADGYPLKETGKIDIEAHFSRVQIRGHESEGFLIQVIDITKRIKATESLKASEEQSRLVLSSLKDRIFVCDKDNIYSQVYTPDGSDTTYSRENLLGKHASEVVPPRLLNPYLNILTEVRETGISQIFEYSVEDEGRERWYISTLTLHEDGESVVSVAREITDTKDAEQSLRKSEERYRLVLDSMRDLVFVYDKDDCYNQVYASDESLLIHSKDEIIGKHVSEVMPPHHLEVYLNYSTKIRETGISQSFDYLVKFETTDKWFTSTFTLHEDGESIVSVAREITEKKLSELALAISEDRFRKFFDNAPIYFYMVSPEGLILNASKEALKVLGYSKDELVGQPVTTIYAPEVLTKMQELFEGWKQTGHIDEVETTIITKNGERREVILLVDAQFDSEGEFLNSISIQVDITDRKLTEEALRESENRFKAVVESSFNGIFIHIDDKIVEANQSFADMVISTKDLLIGLNPLDLITEESREIVLNSVIQEEVSSMLLELIRNDGTIARIETYASPCIYQGKNARIVAIRDITEVEEARDALEKSEDQIRRLFKGIPVSTYAWQWIGDDFVLVDFNDEAEAVTQGGIKRLLGQKASVVLKDQPEIFEFILRVFKNKTGEEQEFYYKFQSIDKESTIQAKLAFVPPDLVIAHARDITQEREAQKALEESEAKKESILRVAPVGIGIVKNRILTYVSNSLVNMIGYTRDELLGKNSRILYASDDEYLRVGKQKYEQIDKYGTGLIDTQFVCKDGIIIDVDLRSTPIDLDDLEKGVTFTALDISTRIRAARAISENEEKYRLLIDSMEQGILILQGSPPKVVYANMAIEKLIGYSPEKLIDLESKKFVELFHQKNYEQSVKTIDGIIDGSIEAPEAGIEHEVLNQDGKTVWLIGHPKRIMYDGQPAFRQIFVDITSRKHAEQQLKHTQALLNAVLEQSPYPMSLTTADGKIEILNEASRIQLEAEHRPSFEEGMIWVEVERPQRVTDSEGNEMEHEDLPMARALRGEQTVKKQFRIERMDGTTRWEEIDGVPIHDAEGNIIAGLVVFPDITERKLAQEELVRTKTLLTAVMEQSPIPMFLVNSGGKIEMLNEACLKQYESEHSIKEHLNESWLEMGSGQDLFDLDGNLIQKENYAIAKALRGIPTQKQVIKCARKDGSTRYEEIDGVPIFDSDGNIIAGLVIFPDITERTLAQEELVRTQTLLSAVIEQSPIPMFITTADLKFLLMNEIGFNQHEREVKSRQEFYDSWPVRRGEQALYDLEGNILEHDDRPLAKALRGIRTHKQIIKITRKDGTTRYEEIDGVPIHDAEGNIIAGLVIFPDITERTLAQEELVRTKTLLAAVIEQSPIPMFLVGSDGQIEMLNEACLKQYESEYSVKEYLDATWSEMGSGQSLFDSDGNPIKIEDRPLAKALRGIRTQKQIIKVERKDGTIRFEEVDGVPVYDADGKLVAAFTIFSDITQRKLAEEELKTSEEMFRIVTGSMQEGILVVDQDRKVKYSNKEYERMWRIPEELMETKDDVKILEFILDQLPDPLDYLEKVGDLIHSQDQSYNTILLKDGRIFDRYSFPMVSENEIKGRAWIFRDISDEVSVDKKIKQEREALSNFAHRMSHELKNTLAAIGGHASLLEDEHSQESIESIKSLVERASTLMRRSVLLADAGLIIGSMSENSLDSILEDALSVIVSDEIKVEKDALPSVRCDRMKVAQVIRNILQNAIEHGDAKKVEIRVQDDAEGKYILFKNDGKPIPEEQHHKIFTEGFTTKKDGGIGLGIVKKIVEAHGWAISLDEGEPTCFRIFIPNSSR